MASAGGRPVILFAHGAGAPSSSGWMRRFAKHLDAVGDVVTFDYPYMKARRKAPDKPAVLIAAHGEALAEAKRAHPGAAVIFAGKSMGSRIGCHLAVELSEAERPSAIVCFGYPLRSPAGTLRDEVLLALRTPILFVQGARDALCPLETLAGVRAKMNALHELHVVEGGNHSLEVGKRDLGTRGLTQADVEAAIMKAVAAFAAKHTGASS